MKVWKASTVRGRINYYAYRAGFTLHPQSNGKYNLFDIKMKYYVNSNVSMDTVVRVVQDELTLIHNSRNNG